MAVTSAGQASEIVLAFLARMGWSTLIAPRKAELKDGVWVIELIVGFAKMRFEVDDQSGVIKRYETLG